jgi:hypothetical protein
MDLEKETRKDILATIERRLQFVIILSVFLPDVWESAKEISPQILTQIFGNKFDSVGVVVAYVFIAYLFFELLKKTLSKSVLVSISTITLLLSYSLVVVIGMVYVKGSNLAGWELLLTRLGAIGMIIIPAIFLLIIVIGAAVGGRSYLQKIFNKHV